MSPVDRDFDVSLYDKSDLEFLLASVTEALKLTLIATEPVGDLNIPHATRLYIAELRRKIALYQGELARQGALGPGRGKVKILFLAANPDNTSNLSVDEEISRVQKRLRSAEYRDQFELVQEMAVQVTDIPEHLLHHKPTIVHFGGHGNKSGELLGEDRNRLSKAIPVEALAALFGTLKSSIRCVVLNACYAAKQAKLLATHIECTIGMTAAVQDSVAIVFSESFYSGLAYGRSMKESFDLACAQVYIHNPKQKGVPSIYASPGVNLETLYLATSNLK